MTADPKPLARVKDTDAVRRARLRWDACAACGGDAGSAHHVVPKGERGDDVEANLLMLCGHGTAGCHGAEHGNPYVKVIGIFQERRDAAWVHRRIGLTILHDRPDTIAYVLSKMGSERGADYLRRRYCIDLALDSAPGAATFQLTGITIPTDQRGSVDNMATAEKPQVSAVQAMITVLKKARGPLTTKEITSRVLKDYNTGLKGPTPENTMSAKLYVLASKGQTFVRVEKGVFDLVERAGAATTVKAPVAAAAKKPAAAKSKAAPKAAVKRKADPAGAAKVTAKRQAAGNKAVANAPRKPGESAAVLPGSKVVRDGGSPQVNPDPKVKAGGQTRAEARKAARAAAKS